MSAALALSVVMCAYNGAPYLSEQLDSLAGQSTPPDELIVSDDASTDETPVIVADFAKRAPFPVRFQKNVVNAGFMANFETVISAANGDVIALCDQDDVWREDKLTKFRSAFEANPNLGLLFSDGDIVDAAMAPSGQRLFDYARFGAKTQARVRGGDAFDVLLDANVVTGATMAFRADLRELVLPIPLDGGSSADEDALRQSCIRFHDSWIALLSSAVADVEFIAEPLVRYRQHAAQVTGVRKHDRPMILDRGHYQEHLEYLETVDRRLKQSEELTSRLGKLADSRRRLAARIGHVGARSQMTGGRIARLHIVVRELLSGRYSRYSSGVRSALRDVLIR